MEGFSAEMRKTFTTIDYVVFGGVLVLSLFIGLYHALKAQHKNSAEFLMGSYNLTCFPVAMSMLLTYISAILVLGIPSEVYYHGVMFVVVTGTLLANVLVAVIFVQPFYKLRVISVYQYLEMRFGSKVICWLGGGTFVIQIILYLSVVIYAPALALASVMGFPVWLTIVLVGVVGAVYTALGGMRAVVWADVLQTFVMLLGLITVIAYGTYEVGGLNEVWRVTVDMGRTGENHFKWNLSLYERHTVPNLLLYGILTQLTMYGCHQTMIQRYNSMKSIRHVYGALAINIPFHMLLVLLAAFAGLVLLAVYQECDPLAAGFITSKDQILPFYVMDHLNHIPGFVGIFVACLFAGALSSLSSGLNSLAAVLWEDVFVKFKRFRSMSDSSQLWTLKTISVFFGAVCVGLSFLAQRLGGILQADLAVNGAVAGPLLALFIMALFLPFVNATGAALGLLVGHAVALTITFGAITLNMEPPLLPTNVEGCPANLTLPEPPTPITPDDLEYPWKLFAMSYTMYCAVGFSVALVVGSLSSLITGCNKSAPPDKSLLHPLVHWALPKSEPVLPPQNNGTSKHGQDGNTKSPSLSQSKETSSNSEMKEVSSSPTSFSTKL